MHRFKEAEPLARALVAQRGAPFDYGLLGDVLMEIGRLDEAIGAYQKMMELKPDLHAYARAAHVRWLKGDVTGAVEAMRMAADATSPQDAESAAWSHTRLALYQFQAGHAEDAHKTCEVLVALAVESKDRVNELLEKALEAGGREPRGPNDYGFMFLRTFEDPDGHLWEIFWMDPGHVR